LAVTITSGRKKEKMRIGIDARLISPNEMRGMGLYLYNILKNIDTTAKIFLFTNNYRNLNYLIAIFKDKKNFHFFLFESNEVIFEQIYLPSISFVKKMDCFVHSGDTSSIIWNLKCRRILILHDVAFTKNSSKYPAANSVKRNLGRLYRSFTIGLTINSVAKIITVSNFAAKDILKTYGKHLKKKIAVIPNGLNEQFIINSDFLKNKENYALLVTGSDPQKNCNFFINTLLKHAAFLQFIDHIFIVGISNHNEINVNYSNKISYLGYIPSSELSNYYKKSNFLFIPSLYESFGVPSIESLASGCHVLASTLGALPEVLENHAIFFNPKKAHDINKMLSYVCNLKIKTTVEHKKNINFLRKYNWKNGSQMFIDTCVKSLR
jgi:glycosyltransferase involved in cell wall biosynthesis